jgi:hypothetical protein
MEQHRLFSTVNEIEPDEPYYELSPVHGGDLYDYFPSVRERRKKSSSIVMMLVSTIVLIGNLGWFVLVASITGVSQRATELSHVLNLATSLAVLTNLLLYMIVRRQTACPIYMMIAATVLITTDLLMNVLQDFGYVRLPMFRDGCEQGYKCLSAFGWFYSVVFKCFGYICLVGSMVWVTNERMMMN